MVIGGGVLLLYFVFPDWLRFLRPFDDEPPIRVHNGSFVVETTAEFKAENGDIDDPEPSYSHETVAHNGSKDVYAYISPATSSNCTGTLSGPRKEIVVTYRVDVTGTDRDFTFKRGHQGNVYATKIRKINDVTLGPKKLTYGAGLLGHISKVELKGPGSSASCTFTAKDDVKIAICSTASCSY